MEDQEYGTVPSGSPPLAPRLLPPTGRRSMLSTMNSRPSGTLRDLDLSTNSHRRTVSHSVIANKKLPVDEWPVYNIDAKDEETEFFENGRDLQSRKTKHHFTEEEKEIMGAYESTAVKPSHTAAYKDWILHKPSRSDSESWVTIGLIALIIGILAFCLKMICEKLEIFYNPFMKDFVERGETLRLWLYMTGISCIFGGLSSIVIVYGCPAAGGSGVPEIIGILNGVVVQNVLGVRTLVCKIVSCIFTVVSGLPVGFEGPMIHIGAMVAATMARPVHCDGCCTDKVNTEESAVRNKRKRFCRKYFSRICRYRDCQERYNLISVGTAAGVAAAFSSPITGLAFALEEMSTHWSNSLTWQTFVCCILARSTTELLHSVVSSMEHQFKDKNHTDGAHIFELSESAVFDMKVLLRLNISVFVPTVIIGVLGGFLGSLYIFMHLKMARYRRKLLRNIKSIQLSNVLKVLEVIVVCFIFSTLLMSSMSLFDCNRVNHSEEVVSKIESRHIILRPFRCNVTLHEKFIGEDNVVVHDGYFHEGATLMFGSWEQMVRNLLSRKTHDFFGITCLLVILLLFFLFSSWAAMTAIASGLLIPQLAIGALYGRLVGKCIHDLFRQHMEPGDDPAKWDFTDPGALALLGAASFFAGTSRQPITSVVMMAEMTNDINMSLLVMICVMLARFIGDMFTHSLTHSLLEFKCIPHLDPELRIYHKRKRINLELYSVSDIMSTPVLVADIRSSIYDLANLLLDSNHGAFPVVMGGRRGFERIFMGNITRLELTVLLTKTDTFDVNELQKKDIDKIRMSYPEYSSNKLKDCAKTKAILETFSIDFRYTRYFVNLLQYINLSSHSVSTHFSLDRTYTMFRDLGLRHLVVVDELNQVQGIVTRKDLMGFSVEETIHKSVTRARFRSRQRKRDAVEDVL